MHGTCLEFNGIRIFQVPADGPELKTARAATDLISAASEHQSEFIVIPVERLGDEFFDLRTRIAGEFVQKFAMYGRRIAIVGNIKKRIEASRSLFAFVAESNRGRDLWFLENLDELAVRLASCDNG